MDIRKLTVSFPANPYGGLRFTVSFPVNPYGELGPGPGPAPAVSYGMLGPAPDRPQVAYGRARKAYGGMWIIG